MSTGTTGHLIAANVRAHARRYVATGLAVAISIAFVAASLVFMSALGSSITSGIRSTYEGVAAVVTIDTDSVDGSATEATDLEDLIPVVEKADGVGEVVPYSRMFVDASANDHTQMLSVQPINPEPFGQPVLVDGALPATASEVAIGKGAAEALEVGVGDTVTVPTPTAEDTERTTELRVTGILQDSLMSFQSLVVTREGAAIIDRSTPFALFVAKAGTSERPGLADQEALVASVQQALDSAGVATKVQTGTAVEEKDLSDMRAAMAANTSVILAFPGIALVVAMIVVSTTFQVILQQRRRELALLRTLGARRRQVRSVILAEAGIVGLVASALGTAVGVLVAVAGVKAMGMVPTLAAGLAAVNPAAFIGVWLFGALLTVVIGLRPALSVARISPIAALAPVDEASAQVRRSHWLRLVFGLVLGLGGAGVIAAATVVVDDEMARFGVIFLAAIVALLGAILTCTVVLPALTRLVGRLVPGVVAGMARENTMRNPGRTAATGTAIVIGVTLMTTMLVGASSLRATLTTEVNRARPFDLAVVGNEVPGAAGDVSAEAGAGDSDMEAPVALGPGVISEEDQKRIVDTEGVAASVSARAVLATLSRTDGSEPEGANDWPWILIGEPDLATVRHADTMTVPTGDVVLMSEDNPASDLDTVRVCTMESSDTSATGSGTRACSDFTVQVDGRVQSGSMIITADALERLAPDAPVHMMVLRLDEDASASDVQANVQKIDSSLTVGGSAVERELYFTTIDQILLVVLALLGVSVVVSLVGVTNTLGLSVAERTRENGLLRALGLTKRQMKRMLAWESLFISLTGALVGLALGVGFGWAGILALPLEVDEPQLVVPLVQVGGVVLVAIVSAVVAAWLPGRKAARTSPVVALATE